MIFQQNRTCRYTVVRVSIRPPGAKLSQRTPGFLRLSRLEPSISQRHRDTGVLGTRALGAYQSRNCRTHLLQLKSGAAQIEKSRAVSGVERNRLIELLGSFGGFS